MRDGAPAPLRVRPADEGDAAFVAELVPRFAEHGLAGGHTRDEVIDGTRRVLTDALRADRDGELFLIAEDADGERAGFVYAVSERDFFTAEPYAHVSEIAAARSGGGAGGVLMHAVESWARERGYGRVTLNVVEANAAGERFYRRHGYDVGHIHFVKRL